MGKSRVVKVSVTKTPTDVTIALDRYDGTPGVINVYGALYKKGTSIVLSGKTIQILIGGSLGASVTTGTDGRYRYTFVASADRYSFQAKFPGDANYVEDWSPLVIGDYGKIGTSLTIDVNPLAGSAPLAVTILGLLSRDDTGGGIPGKTVELWRNNVKIKTTTTRTVGVPLPPIGAYLFHDTISVDAEYYVYFTGDTTYEGCEASDGSTVLDGVPPDEEPPVDGRGAGILLLLALVLSQE